MTTEEIIAIENKPLFRFFLKRIWFKSFDEYIELFWKDYEKREETVQRFKETYKNLYAKKTNLWKD